jgi:hypothetical protein
MLSNQQILVFLGLTAVITFSPVQSLGNVIITSKGYIPKLCEKNCQQNMDNISVEHCERGCRFFDLAQTSDMLDLNKTVSTELCMDSCKEAYLSGKNQDICIVGCNKAKEGVDHLEEMANRLMEEAEKQMSFLNSIFNMMSSSLWSSSDSEESEELVDDHGDVWSNPPLFRPVDTFGDAVSNVNRLDKNSNNDVEIITLMGHDMASVDPMGNSVCTTRIWLHRLSFILIVMGALSLLLVSCFYILAVIKHKKQVRNLSQSTGDLSRPPSYETLVKDGFIVITNGEKIMTSKPEKDEKPFIA